MINVLPTLGQMCDLTIGAGLFEIILAKNKLRCWLRFQGMRCQIVRRNALVFQAKVVLRCLRGHFILNLMKRQCKIGYLAANLKALISKLMLLPKSVPGRRAFRTYPYQCVNCNMCPKLIS